jgi:large subunit ribosomal protein L18
MAKKGTEKANQNEKPKQQSKLTKTLIGVSTLGPDFKATGAKAGTVEGAKAVGEIVGKKALEAGIDTVVFDRGGHIYHGRVAAVAEGAREAGLKF